MNLKNHTVFEDKMIIQYHSQKFNLYDLKSNNLNIPF